MRSATVALVVQNTNGKHQLVDTLSDDREINVLESAITTGETDPLSKVYTHRESQAVEENEFADYVEELLSHPFLRREIQEHGVQWLKSKMRIEQYQKSETEAAKIIAEYAFQLFCHEPDRTDFFLAGPSAEVRVRIFVIGSESYAQAA